MSQQINLKLNKDIIETGKCFFFKLNDYRSIFKLFAIPVSCIPKFKTDSTNSAAKSNKFLT